MSEDSNFNPFSRDAMTAKILSRLDNQDYASAQWRTESMELMKAIKEAVDKTNGRVTNLEQEKWLQRGFGAGISLAATALWQWWTNKR